MPLANGVDTMAPIGFIQNELDLKLLVLYIMARVAQPVTFPQLLELALCDAGVDYFSLTQAVEHMVAGTVKGLLACEQGGENPYLVQG